MSEKQTVTLGVAIRPRVDGEAVFYGKGEDVPVEHINQETLKELDNQGLVTWNADFEAVPEPEPEQEAPAPEEPTQPEPEPEEQEELEPEQEAPVQEEGVEPVKDKPTGIWNFDIEQIKELELDVLNAMYKNRANEFDLSLRSYSDKDKLLKKLTSEA
jgi:hypothetical protein